MDIHVYAANEHGVWVFLVERETPKTYYLRPYDRTVRAPDMPLQLRKADAHHSPAAAVDAYINDQEQRNREGLVRVQSLLEAIQHRQERIMKARAMSKTIQQVGPQTPIILKLKDLE